MRKYSLKGVLKLLQLLFLASHFLGIYAYVRTRARAHVCMRVRVRARSFTTYHRGVRINLRAHKDINMDTFVVRVEEQVGKNWHQPEWKEITFVTCHSYGAAREERGRLRQLYPAPVYAVSINKEKV